MGSDQPGQSRRAVLQIISARLNITVPKAAGIGWGCDSPLVHHGTGHSGVMVYVSRR